MEFVCGKKEVGVLFENARQPKKITKTWGEKWEFGQQ